MKRLKFSIFALIALLSMSSLAVAGPFVICDPYPTTAAQPTVFVLIMDSGAAVDSPPQTMTDGSKRLYFDVGGVTSGNHTVKVKACLDSAEWGRICSSETPFSFTRPAGPAAPANFGLIK